MLDIKRYVDDDEDFLSPVKLMHKFLLRLLIDDYFAFNKNLF
jgi:hypothetical protein